ncbi:hypothetical protein KSF_108030 [Reticulibacter mediterranei]|uniref:PPM-type phosphatase domain-containing protein n=1 Tax=Reticulibacter mediterranei TaxID=2778369 RepID=A0A8J3J1T8_9CHLR|nr:protein phosphatase 2C domain-containing protein [Reticulibacter mediterranei]GHP00756.1 hypothetical protein KSF_108030 [Reticulibacter mediterranei]
MSTSEGMVLAYLRNMRAAQQNEQPEHARHLFNAAMSWLEQCDKEDEQTNDSLQLNVGVGLDAGTNPRKSVNEDYVFAVSMLNRVQERVGLFLVADGVGGAIDGQEASRRAVHAFVNEVLPQLLEEPLRREALRDLLVAGIQAANQAVYQRNQDPMLLGSTMGTTFTAVVSVGCDAYVSSIGDSRAYVYREGTGLMRLTQDHSKVAELVKLQVITPREAYYHPERNVILRALGGRGLEIDEPIQFQLQKGDVLLLCSDGLWEMVRDPRGDDMAAILKRNLSAEEMAENLVRLALSGGGPHNTGGGHDNIGIVVVKMEVDVAECETMMWPPTPSCTETMVVSM